MQVPDEVKAELYERFGDLIHDVVSTDLGWHSFSVLWSDDEGRTTEAVEFTRRGWRQEMLSFSPSGIEELLREKRARAKGLDSEA